jgi:fibro-slime domain-containing protein
MIAWGAAVALSSVLCCQNATVNGYFFFDSDNKGCGNGVIEIGLGESCDDGNALSADGCSGSCALESGWACGDGGQACHKTNCNDGVQEGDEPCDDGNNVVGDGCSPFCEAEPLCDNVGPCTSRCGDGMMIPGGGEECDDGNTRSGDGCSAICEIEAGFSCDIVTAELPAVLEVPITYRDFISFPNLQEGGVRHPDFQMDVGDERKRAQTGLVLPELDTDGKPEWSGVCSIENPESCDEAPETPITSTKEAFSQWYRDAPGVNITKVSTLSLARQTEDKYYVLVQPFFPWDNDGWVSAGDEITTLGHNYGFTSELRTWFEFKGSESLTFTGDDDIWVFVNKRLVIDMGGLHRPTTQFFILSEATAGALELIQGHTYEIVIFQAERQTAGSSLALTLKGFVRSHSTCATKCGDKILAGEEECDDGNTASGDGCDSACQDES